MPGSREAQESAEQMRFYGRALHLAVIRQRVANAGDEAGLWDADSKKSEHELKRWYPPVCLPKALITIV